MSFSAKLRKKIFFIKDRLMGGEVYKHLQELNYFDTLSKQDVKKNQNLKLKKITNYASNNCEFYKNIKRFEDFPIIDKQIIKQQENKFLSKKFELKNLIPVVTSGSTGTPFKVYQDIHKKNRNTADTIHFAKKAFYDIGEPLYYLKIWNKFNAKSFIKQKAENVYPVNVFDLSKEAIKNYVIEWNKSKSPIALLGYASSIFEIAKFVSNHIHLKKFEVHSIITMSESLDSYSREFISKTLNCNVYSRYSNVENGIIAQQFDLSNSFLINSASYKVEIFKIEKDEIEEEGKVGRIVISDLYNYGMPIIRYDTGDLGSMKTVSKYNRTFEVLDNIEGRRMDAIYNTNGNLLSSFIITNGMWNYSEVDQYQFIQNSSSDYTFRLNINEKFDREQELIDDFKKYLGDNATINIEYVNEIPLLSSGKRKKVVNNYYK